MKSQLRDTRLTCVMYVVPLLLLYLFPILNTTYTHLSIVNGICAYIFCFDQMVPLLFVNHLAIMVSFHAPYLIDKNVFKVFEEFYTHFWIGNFINHVAPTLYYGWYMYAFNIRAVSPHIGLMTLMYHVMWRYRVSDSFLLDTIYLKLPPETWYFAWVVAATTHIASPWLLGLSPFLQ